MRGHAGKHTVDPDLLTVAQTHGNVHIVTRNAHADDIRAFLQEHGVRQSHPFRRRTDWPLTRRKLPPAAVGKPFWGGD